MSNTFILPLHCFSFFLILNAILFHVSAYEDRKLHVVYMGSLGKEEYLPLSQHLSLLQGVIKTSPAENLLIRSYQRSFNGFAAMLSDYEAKQLASSKEVVSVFPSQTYQLHTTRSWSFLGFDETTHQNPIAESDIVIGVLDSGIWPESESFNDEGFGPPPKKWKGICNGGQNFTCNNKIIGARYYGMMDSARDDFGHGTHTASTAAGNKVKDASFLGLANGVARGGVPSSRIAVYKACGPINGCPSANLLAAFDDAIADGVDIITISLGFPYQLDYPSDVIAIGAFHAMEKGILTSQSAGNDGPRLASVSSTAPWLLSVAASTIDRKFIDKVILGNGMTLIGSSINSFDLKGEDFPVISGGQVKTSNCSDSLARSCFNNCLNNSLVKGKIVLCDDATGINEAMRAGAVGSILRYNGMYEAVASPVPLPATILNSQEFDALTSYLQSAEQPTAKLLTSETIKDSTAPLVASSSSRGPNLIVGDLLKPDIVAPGVNILAAYPPNLPPTQNPLDKRSVKYNILFGTSMACPHAAGVAAYVKTFHPEWSPSAIKSAIMTTALPINSTTNSGAEFAYGSGHINPLRAINPGLVYEAQKEDYITFLCSIGYNESRVGLISGDNSTNCHQSYNVSRWHLNYPSLTAKVRVNETFTISFVRTVTNVGIPKSNYKAEVSTTSNLKIETVPNVLSFNSIKEKKSFNVTVQGGGLTDKQIFSASLMWSDGTHLVTSPIVIYSYQIE